MTINSHNGYIKAQKHPIRNYLSKKTQCYTKDNRINFSNKQQKIK